MSRGSLVKRAMRSTRGFNQCCSSLVKRSGNAKAAGWRSGGPAKLKTHFHAQRSKSDRVIFAKSGPEIPNKSASRVEGTSISRNVCLMSIRRLMRQTARTNIDVFPGAGITTPGTWCDLSGSAMPHTSTALCAGRMANFTEQSRSASPHDNGALSHPTRYSEIHGASASRLSPLKDAEAAKPAIQPRA